MATAPERKYAVGTTGAGVQVGVDVGLRAYMLRVYQYMAGGLALTGAVALYVANSPAAMSAIFGTPLAWVVMLAPLGLIFFFSFRADTMSPTAAQVTFWVFAALIGISLATIFLVYTHTSIVRVFFITAASFGALSLWGYTTQRDISAWGSFLIMGLFGIIIAMLVNIFLQSSALHWTISVIGVLVFTGLTAYDAQRIKEMYYAGDGAEIATKKAVMGALQLYLDFINLFVFLLQFLGERR